MRILANKYRRLAEGVSHAAGHLVASLTLRVSVATASIGEEH
jgi:hypothetical protein